jgi:molybdopterin molybdotransferase
VIGRVLAGATLDRPLGPGEAARIMTGAPIPEGADAVCMVELTHLEGEEPGWKGPASEGLEAPHRVVIEVPLGPGDYVRDAGGDVRAGELLLDAGRPIGPTQLGTLVSAGCTDVSVWRRPRVGVISTGDELVEAGERLGPAQIHDSNRPMVLAMVAEAGCEPHDLGRNSDEVASLCDRIEGALPWIDVLVLSGGVSVGDVDVVRMALEKLGAGTAHWLQIAIKPAKPFSFVVLEGPSGPVPVFGLPGNPVSSAVSFELLVRPALRAMAGDPVTTRPRLWARAGTALRRRPDGKLHLVRVQLARGADGGWVVEPCPGQNSHQIRSLALADGLALLPDGDGLAEGEMVEVLVTDPAMAGSLPPY